MPKTAFPLRRSSLATAVIAALASSRAALVLAQPAPLVLEEIIVTAQKRAESVQDISATVNVVTGDDVDKFAAFNFNDIEQQTAGLTLASPNARNSSISMRGIGTDPEAGTPPAVDVYWNDMNVRTDVAFSQLYDLERLEVLRGPQGTLQGRTSPAGAINIITRKADVSEPSGYVSATAADNDGFNGQIAYGMPLIEDVLAVRVAAVYDTNYAADVENITTGLDDPEAKAKSARFSVVWEPSAVFSANLIWQYFDRDVDDPKAVTGTDSLGERPTLGEQDRIALGKSNNFGEFEYDIVNLTLDWEVAGHAVTAVTGYNNSEKTSRTENDLANYVTTPEALTWQRTATDVESIAQEIRIASMDNDFWDYMFGLYYIDQETTTSFLSNTTLRPPTPEISFASTGAIPVDSEEFGIFTFNTIYLSDLLQLEVGLRWSRFESFRRADIFFGGLVYLPPPLQAIEDATGAISSGIAASFPIIGVSDENSENDEDAVTGSLKLRYEWTDDTSLYMSYTRGYRPGGIAIVPTPNIAFLPNGEDDLLYDEETSDSVELGFKSRLMDGRATLNGALYYQQFDGYFGFKRGLQVLDDAGEPVDLPGGVIYNGDANIWGVEFEGQILLSESWSAGGSLAYNKSEWDGAVEPCNEREPGEALGSCDIDGEPLGGEPEWSVTLNSEYFIPFENMEWYVRGLYKYTGKRDNTDASAGIGAVTDEFDAHNVLNLYTGLRSPGYTWDVSLWAKNLFDEEALTFQQGSDQYDIAFSGGSYTQVNVLPERTIGVTARYNF